jgi:hypothetical protein
LVLTLEALNWIHQAKISCGTNFPKLTGTSNRALC